MASSPLPAFGSSSFPGAPWSGPWSTHGFDHGPADGRGSGGGQGGGGQGGGPMPRGCLFGGWRGMHIDDDLARNRPPLPGVAALGLMVVVVALLALWFIAR